MPVAAIKLVERHVRWKTHTVTYLYLSRFGSVRCIAFKSMALTLLLVSSRATPYPGAQRLGRTKPRFGIVLNYLLGCGVLRFVPTWDCDNFETSEIQIKEIVFHPTFMFFKR